MPGKDWFCRNCGVRNFSRNKDCIQCDSPIDYDGGGNQSKKGGGRSRDGSWFCYNCGDNHPPSFDKCPYPDKETEDPGPEMPPWGGDGGTGERAATGAWMSSSGGGRQGWDKNRKWGGNS